MRKHAQHYRAHVHSFSRAQKASCVHVKACILLFFILGTLYVVTPRKSMKKKPEKILIFTDLKLKIMLYEPFLFNMV